MQCRRVSVVWVIALSSALMAIRCGNTTPTQPSGNSSVTAPQPQQPANSSQIPYASQPVTLTVQNAIVTAGSSVTYTFEVATDTTFTNKVQTKDGVTQSSGGQTTVRLDSLGGGKDYYWHARATGGGTTGVFGATYKFTVGAAVTISAPGALGPLTGAQSSPRPALRVSNAARQGPAGAITYKFEVAKDSSFTSLTATGTSNEGSGETDFIPSNELPTGATLFWRATASDASNGITSAPSAVQSFTVIPFSQAERVAAQLGVALWPGVQPPGNVGQATMGDNWQVQTLFHAPTNTYFQSPTPEDLRIFDLLDRGFDPDGAIGWMNRNGYFTAAMWYPPPDKAVIGLAYTYIAARNKVLVNGTWDIVLKGE